jgi:hypothetical protein
MRYREGVVDEDVAEFGERGDEGRIVLLLAGVEAGVLQAENVAGLHLRHGVLGGIPDAVVDKFERPLDDARHLGGHQLERIFLIASLRAAEMREQDHLGALVGDLGNRARHALDAGGIGDDAVLHRHVEVDAHQDAFALHVGMIESAERAHGSPRASSVSRHSPDNPWISVNDSGLRGCWEAHAAGIAKAV